MIRLSDDQVFYYKISSSGLKRTTVKEERSSFKEIFNFLRDEKSLNIKQLSQFAVDWPEIKSRFDANSKDRVKDKAMGRIACCFNSFSLGTANKLDEQVKRLNEKLNLIKMNDLKRFVEGLELKVTFELSSDFLHHLWLWYRSDSIDFESKEISEKREIACKRMIECKYNENKKILILDDLHLRTLPFCVGEITHLQILTLSANYLTTLPNSLSRLRHLRKLDVSGNQLKQFPDCLESLSNLIQLDLQFNEISILPGSLGRLKKLQSLILNGNKLKQLPDFSKLTRLKFLNLSDNFLESLPETLGDCQELEWIHIDSNRKLNELPLYLSRLPKLTFGKHYFISNQLKFHMEVIKEACKAQSKNDSSQFFCKLLMKWIKFAGRRRIRVTSELVGQLKMHLWAEEIGCICEWLICLEKNQYFRGFQVNLAKLTCEMLQDLLENSIFKRSLFGCIKKTNLESEEHVARAYYEIYTSYIENVNSRYEYPEMMESLESKLGINFIRVKSARSSSFQTTSGSC